METVRRPQHVPLKNKVYNRHGKTGHFGRDFKSTASYPYNEIIVPHILEDNLYEADDDDDNTCLHLITSCLLKIQLQKGKFLRKIC